MSSKDAGIKNIVYKSTDVSKLTEPYLDLGNLLIIDRDPIINNSKKVNNE